MATTITIDPVTRIEGHLKAEVTVDGGVVTDAKVSGTMARGIENLLLGRDPRDATYVTERICGVCFGAHGWTSCLAVEQAHGTRVLPEAARLIRNLTVGACWLHDHPLHFYHLSALDYLDLTALASYDGSDTHIQKIRDLAVCELDNPPIEGEYAGPLLPHYDYTKGGFWINDLDTVVMAVQHYLDALVMQVKAKRMSALLSGKQPHQSGMIVGGVTQKPSYSTRQEFRNMLMEQIDFVNNVYVNDVVTLGTGPLLGLATSPVGVGHQNYLAYGGFPEGDGSFLYPEGAIVNGSLVANSRATIEPSLSEDVTNSWYTSGGGGHPSSSSQIFDLEKTGAHSFIKAPRFQGNPMEVGPLARMMVAINRPDHPAHNHPATQQLISLVNAGVQPGAVARHAARALETQILCDAMVRWLDELEVVDSHPRVQIHDTAHWDPPSGAAIHTGVGMTEAPRGALAHWVAVQSEVIDHYACVVPTTWNASPTDNSGNRGPYEEALIGCPVDDTDNPVNVVRIIRSFDPCIACAVHVISPKGDMKKFVLDF